MPMLNRFFFNKKNPYLDEIKGSKIVTFKQESIQRNTKIVL